MTGSNTYLTQAEAADLLRLSARTLDRYRVEGSGPRFIKAGRRVLYSRAELEDWLAKRNYSSTSEASEGRES